MKIPGWPCYDAEEARAVSEVLLSNRVNYWTGSEGLKFESEFARWTGAERAIALANGTLALDAALVALGVGPGDEVIVTPRSFIASVSAVVLAGATPVFADVDADSQNVTAETIESVITKRTKAVIPVHLAGWPCDMVKIMSLAESHSIAVIEDCAQAHGARFRNQSVGTFGQFGAWSFCQDKIITTGGEGGMLTTNHDELAESAWSFKDHGKSSSMRLSPESGSRFRWIHHSFGTNYRLTEMQSAIGRVQLSRVQGWQRRRHDNAMLLASVLADAKGLRVPLPPAECVHAWYKFYAFTEEEALKSSWSRDRIVEELQKRGIPCFSGSCPEIYLEKAFDHTGWRPKARLPVARQLGETSLAFSVHPTLDDQHIVRFAEAVRDVMADAIS